MSLQSILTKIHFKSSCWTNIKAGVSSDGQRCWLVLGNSLMVVERVHNSLMQSHSTLVAQEVFTTEKFSLQNPISVTIQSISAFHEMHKFI